MDCWASAAITCNPDTGPTPECDDEEARRVTILRGDLAYHENQTVESAVRVIEGSDVLTANPGQDMMFGGAGADTYVLDLPDTPSVPLDRIRDFVRNTRAAG